MNSETRDPCGCGKTFAPFTLSISIDRGTLGEHHAKEPVCGACAKAIKSALSQGLAREKLAAAPVEGALEMLPSLTNGDPCPLCEDSAVHADGCLSCGSGAKQFAHVIQLERLRANPKGEKPEQKEPG